MGDMHKTVPQISSGIAGLDSLLSGGFVEGRLYLVQGAPGTGKTILGMHFLENGLDAGEDVLFIHGEEAREGVLTNASQLDIDITAANFLDIGPKSDFFTQSQSYDVVDPQDVEENGLVSDIRETIDDLDPDRVFIDPITQFQYLEATEYQYRKRIISFARFLTDRGTTTLATKTPEPEFSEQLRSLSNGVVLLEYGDDGRRIRVPKHRAVGQRDGVHGLEIRDDGLNVYPVIRPERGSRSYEPTQLTTGIPAFDTLLGGGLEQGTVTIISGPSGVGKSTTATEFLQQVAESGDGALAYLFEESLSTFSHRSEQFDIPISRLREDGSLVVEPISALERSPEEFSNLVKEQVEEHESKLVVIDGIQGYKNSIKGGGDDVELRRRLHALTEYLTNMNVSVVLLDERHEITGLSQATSTEMSYLADNLVYQQYVEINGDLRRIVGVLKKRVGGFETRPREFTITGDGLTVGEEMTGYHGILTGLPEERASDSSSVSK